jgi:rhamnosyltransferase
MNLEKIIAVIVLYKCSLQESVTFNTLLDAVALSDGKLTVLVYNNSPDYWQHDEKEYNQVEIIYVADSNNSGVSKAYNVAFSYALKFEKKFLLLLDQDTSIASNLFTSFFNSFKRYAPFDISIFCPQIENIDGLLSPARFFLYTSKKLKKVEPGLHTLKGLAIINSGLFIFVPFFKRVGGYNERIKLDFSDFDFLRRSLKFSQQIVVLDSKCKHSLSTDEKGSINSALSRFDYYLEGALHYEKTCIDAAGLYSWIFVRSLKLNLRYQTLKFSMKVLSLIFNKK